MDPAGRTAIVTGAASGIGRATAALLADRGATVIAADVSADGLRDLAGADSRIVRVEADVATVDGVRTLFARADEAGGAAIVCNNAGITPTGGGVTWLDTPLERSLATVAVNLGGVALGTQLGVQAMRDRGGVIVNTSSMAARIRVTQNPIYAATKAGVMWLMECCVEEAAALGVRVNTVLPGLIDTGMTRQIAGDDPPAHMRALLDRILPPEAVAEVILALIEDDTAVGRAVEVLNP